jgi:hypothetical protein
MMIVSAIIDAYGLREEMRAKKLEMLSSNAEEELNKNIRVTLGFLREKLKEKVADNIYIFADAHPCKHCSYILTNLGIKTTRTEEVTLKEEKGKKNNPPKGGLFGWWNPITEETFWNDDYFQRADLWLLEKDVKMIKDRAAKAKISGGKTREERYSNRSSNKEKKESESKSSTKPQDFSPATHRSIEPVKDHDIDKLDEIKLSPNPNRQTPVNKIEIATQTTASLVRTKTADDITDSISSVEAKSLTFSSTISSESYSEPNSGVEPFSITRVAITTNISQLDKDFTQMKVENSVPMPAATPDVLFTTTSSAELPPSPNPSIPEATITGLYKFSHFSGKQVEIKEVAKIKPMVSPPGLSKPENEQQEESTEESTSEVTLE